MELKLHSNASTTPRTRKYIQSSSKSDSELAKELSISVDTVRRWRNRECFHDKSHRPKLIHKTLTEEQELLIIYLRKRLHLSLDELLEASRMLINKSTSRVGISRSLKKYNIGRIKKNNSKQEKNKVIIDCFKLPPLMSKQTRYLLVCIDDKSSYISFALIDDGDKKAIDNISDFLLNIVPHGFDCIESSPNKIAMTIANNICDSVTSHDDALMHDDYGVNIHNFNVCIDELLSGEIFDKRLGLGAVVLEYEDMLNKRIIRNRLNSQTPYSFITNK